MRNDQLTTELQAIVRVSRDVVMSFGHRYIHTDHLFLAMLQQQDCLAAPYLKMIHADKWAEFTKASHQTGHTLKDKDSVPLTLDAERVFIHAGTFSFAQHKPLTNSIELLLGMIAYDNPIKTEVNKSGWLLKHIVQDHYGADVTFPDLVLKERETISKLRWLLMPKPKKDAWLNRQYNDALTLMNYHLHDAAKKICNTVIDTNRLEPTAYYQLLAVIAYREKDFDNMETILAQLTSIPAWCDHMRSEVAAVKKNYGPVLEILERRIIDEPDNDKLLNNLGYYRSQQGEYATALPYLERAIRITPAYPLPHGNLGYCLYKLGKVQEGIFSIQHAIELDKSVANSYRNLGVIYMETGDKARAKEQFELALKYEVTEPDEIIHFLTQLNEE